jgi:flavin-dependent dehydrogenase
MKLLSLIAVLVLAATAASAGCGAKDTTEGTLKSVDKENNAVVVEVKEGEEVKITLTAKTEVVDADGKKAEVSKLVGSKVKVVSEHAKADSIQQVT